MRFPHPHRLLNARLTRLILCVVVLLQFSAATSAGDSADAEKVAKWIADLKSENVRVRLSAAYNYDRLQPIDEETVKHIIAGLTDSNREVRKYCASALGEIDKDPQLVVPALAQTLRDADRDVREHALVALIKIGVPAAPVLIESLKTAEAAPSPTAPAAADDPELWLRRYALLALTEIGIPAVPALMDASVGKDARLASRAAEALSAIKANEELSVASFLDDKDYRLKLWANQSLERDSELLQMLQHGDKRFRVTIIKSLDRLFSAEQIAVLTKLLNDPDADVRREVVRALGRAYDDSIAPTLARQYPQETKELKLEILSALSRLTDASPPILDLFTAALTDPESEIRERALDGLLSFNAGARVAPTAVRMLAQRPESRRYYSSYYITDMGAVAIPPLIELLKDPNEDIRLFALRSLTQIDRQEDRKTAAVLALLQDPSRKVQVAAAVSLIGTPHSETALQLLMSLAKDPDIQTRQHVLETVRQLRRKPTVSELFVAQCLQDSTVEVRQLGIALLGSEDILSPRLITLLIEKLSDGDDEVQSRAARLLTNGRKQLTSAQVQEITSKLLAAIRQLNPLGANGYSSYYALLYALKDIGDPAKVDEALLELLNSDNAKVVNLVLADLGQRIPEDPRLTAAIIKLLESPNATIRLETIRTVWRLDGIPWSIFPHLKKLNDPDPGIRREVLGSMWRLRQGVTVSVTEV
ncbi:MAG TPA: HEAT repeat domain-containing protein, partial [Pyrinomonadaceae bacterium]|nr:HEAT repeat domain-containing protein [Pyrinomonadaceae bacterium]